MENKIFKRYYFSPDFAGSPVVRLLWNYVVLHVCIVCCNILITPKVDLETPVDSTLLKCLLIHHKVTEMCQVPFFGSNLALMKLLDHLETPCRKMNENQSIDQSTFIYIASYNNQRLTKELPYSRNRFKVDHI